MTSADSSSSGTDVVVTSSSSGDPTGTGGGDDTTVTGTGGSGEGGATGTGGGDDSTVTGTGGSGQGGATGTGGEGTTSSTGGSGQGGGASDEDGDRFTIDEGDCADDNASVFPGATEVCNLVDDNCDGTVDEGFDADADGFSTCNGDCNDANAAVNPDAVEADNDIDDDCNGRVDETFDGDGDGFTPDGGDCDDLQVAINPSALEFVGNNADDDCDGVIDEALAPCDGGALDSNNPLDYARAIGLCNGEVVSATFISGSATGRRILSSYGSNAAPLNQPAEGSNIIHLSSGTADTSTKDPGTPYDGDYAPVGGTNSCTSSAHPDPLLDPGNCGQADPALVCDKTEVELQVRVPSNVQSFSYQFQFLSSEYPTYRCTEYDDTFLAMLSSQALNGGTATNISVDATGHVVSVNNGFFDVCFNDNPNASGGPPNICLEDPIATLEGTGYSPSGGSAPESSIGSGATNPLTTRSPVIPGEVITIRYIIFDEGDDILDSSVLVDDWRWSLDPAAGPSTNPT